MPRSNLVDACNGEGTCDNLTLEDRGSVLSMQGLVCLSPQLDSSSREEMYYPANKTHEVAQQHAAPP